MNNKIDIILLDDYNKIIEQINISRPKDYYELLNKIKERIKNLPNHYVLFYQTDNGENISIKNNEDYKSAKDILFINNKNENLYESIFQRNYHKLSESRRDIIDEKYSCKICSDNIKGENPLFCCQQIYHKRCLEHWENERRKKNMNFSCPNCRNEAPLKNWKEKLNFMENRKNEGEMMNKLNEYERKNNLSNNINKIRENKLENLKNENKQNVDNILNKIIPKMNEINLLIDNNQINVINNDNISEIIVNNFDLITKYISNIKDNQNDIIDKKIENLNKVISELINENNKLKTELNTLNNKLKEININNIANNRKELNLNINYNESGDTNEKQIISLIYYLDPKNSFYDVKYNIFGKTFVENNKNNIELIINGKKQNLIDTYKMNEGENLVITLIIKTKLTDLSFMFYNCISLKNIDELKKLDTSSVKDFSYMFDYCKLSDLKPLQNWDVSNCINFSNMFQSCSFINDLKELENWNVSKGENFSSMFGGCFGLSNLKWIKNWNVSNGNAFDGMFANCISLEDLKGLENFDISKCSHLNNMFSYCKSLKNLKELEKWNVSNCQNFAFMFQYCDSLTNLEGLKNWKVSNCEEFSFMFSDCKKLSDIKEIENWDVSKGANCSKMFGNCPSLVDYSKKLIEKKFK